MARKTAAVSSDTSDNHVIATGDSIPVNSNGDVDVLAQMREMMDEIKSLRSKLAEKDDAKLNEKLDGFEYVPVISLYKYTLNLTTEAYGRGTKYTFLKFGDVKNIMFNDLSKIVNVIPSFFEKGYVYIASPKTVHQLGFDDMYKNILNKQAMEKAIEGKADAVMIYNTANRYQKEVIRDFLISKIRDNPESVDMGLLVAFERDAGIKLIELAEQSKDLLIPQK